MQISADTLTPTGVTGKDCSANPAPFPQSTPVAMAYIPFQQFSESILLSKHTKREPLSRTLTNHFSGEAS